MIKKTNLVWLLCSLALSAGAAKSDPTSDEARKLVSTMQDIVAATGGWHKKPLSARIEALRNAEGLADRASRLIGPGLNAPLAHCRAAAIAMRFYVSNLNDLALITEGRKAITTPADVYSPAFIGFQFGENFNACRAELDEADAKAVVPGRK